MSVWDDIADHLREHASASSTRMERYTVKPTDDGVNLEQIDGDEQLSDGDPDVEVSDAVRKHWVDFGHAGVARVLRDGDTYFVHAIESDRDYS